MEKGNKDTMYFQDLVLSKHHTLDQESSVAKKDGADEDDDSLSLAFFELANAKQVGYRVETFQKKEHAHDSSSDDNAAAATVVIVVRQDTGACGLHTGGIVWETSYLLLEYLQSLHKNLGRTLEVGAGCGMLGLALAACAGLVEKVVLTETTEAMPNLRENVKRNEASMLLSGKKRAVARRLQWEKCHEDTRAHPKSLAPHSFDTIVGTDVVFSPGLVGPLLQTLRLMAHDDTTIYLCIQVRCPDSHSLLLEKAPEYAWQVTEITSELASVTTCAWGLKMECRLLRIKTSKENTSNTTKRKRKWK